MSCTSFLIVSYIPVTEDIRQDAKAVLHPEQLTKIAAAVEIPVFARTGPSSSYVCGFMFIIPSYLR
jgi:hypothetical protein